MKLLETGRFRTVILLLLCGAFLTMTVPFAFRAPYGGERNGYTSGMIRIFCQEPGRFFLKGPQVMLGARPFNYELPLFEWMQGHVARALSGGDKECPAVEPVAKIFSIFWAVIAILAVAWVAQLMFQSHLASLIAAGLLTVDHMWLEYSTYTMIETRTIALLLLAMGVSLSRDKWRRVPRGVAPAVAATLWGLAFMQKPQFWLFFVALWLAFEALHYKKKRSDAILAIGIILSTSVGLAYYYFVGQMNTASDLPWVQWMGPRTHGWYFGHWEDRFTFSFWKSLTQNWFKRSGLYFALVVALLLLMAQGKDRFKQLAKATVQGSLPLLAATFIYPFVFYHVIVVHEYYAHPYNVGSALITGGVLALILNAVRGSVPLLIVAGLLVFGRIGDQAHRGLTRMSSLVDKVKSAEGLWNAQVFPEKNSFVVMACPGNGRDFMHLYMTKQRGFMWCAANEEFAPRKFWKESGVQYVAWARHVETATGRITWEVVPIEKELERARAKGWSSDVKDVWAGRSMTEWAALGSRTGHETCADPKDFDPRNWL